MPPKKGPSTKAKNKQNDSENAQKQEKKTVEKTKNEPKIEDSHIMELDYPLDYPKIKHDEKKIKFGEKIKKLKIDEALQKYCEHYIRSVTLFLDLKKFAKSSTPEKESNSESQIYYDTFFEIYKDIEKKINSICEIQPGIDNLIETVEKESNYFFNNNINEEQVRLYIKEAKNFENICNMYSEYEELVTSSGLKKSIMHLKFIHVDILTLTPNIIKSEEFKDLLRDFIETDSKDLDKYIKRARYLIFLAKIVHSFNNKARSIYQFSTPASKLKSNFTSKDDAIVNAFGIGRFNDYDENNDYDAIETSDQLKKGAKFNDKKMTLQAKDATMPIQRIHEEKINAVYVESNVKRILRIEPDQKDEFPLLHNARYNIKSDSSFINIAKMCKDEQLRGIEYKNEEMLLSYGEGCLVGNEVLRGAITYYAIIAYLKHDQIFEDKTIDSKTLKKYYKDSNELLNKICKGKDFFNPYFEKPSDKKNYIVILISNNYEVKTEDISCIEDARNKINLPGYRLREFFMYPNEEAKNVFTDFATSLKKIHKKNRVLGLLAFTLCYSNCICSNLKKNHKE